METKKLIGLLSIIGEIKSDRWQTVMDIVDCIKSDSTGEVEILEKKWADNYKQAKPDLFPLDLSDIKTWSTYDKCINVKFYLNDEILFCEAIIFDGDSFHGHQTRLRFTTELILPHSFIHKLEKIIMNSFENFLENLYFKNLEKQKMDWIENMRKFYIDKVI